nr:unnamed protein product [Spirometra erinaceieuropaei]
MEENMRIPGSCFKEGEGTITGTRDHCAENDISPSTDRIAIKIPYPVAVSCILLRTCLSVYGTKNVQNVFQKVYEETSETTQKAALCGQPNYVGRLNISWERLDYEELAAQWGLPKTQTIWQNDSNFTDVAYTLERPGTNDSPAATAVWTPVNCEQPEALAIIIPFRDRYQNLSVFLNHMHPLLRHQRRRYSIFVIEQIAPHTFNRAALFNIGFLEASKRADFGCFMFHDVDLLPEDDRNMYACEDQPLHMSATIDKFNYKLFYNTSFGGAVAMRKEHFERTLGFANTYFGWGCEDDDMSRRLRFAGLKLTRRNFTFARYTMLKHGRDKGNQENPKRKARLAKARILWEKDTYLDVRYEIRKQELRHNGLYHYFGVDILQPNEEVAKLVTMKSSGKRP